MESIPDRSAELASLKKRLQREKIAETVLAVLLVITLLSLVAIPRDPGTGLPFPPVIVLVLTSFAGIAVFRCLRAYKTSEDKKKERLEVLSIYEGFRHRYNSYHQNPTKEAGNELYAYYHTFQSRHGAEDKIMDNVMAKCPSYMS